MIKSMTGYGKANLEKEKRSLETELAKEEKNN